jgi:trimeric autotransporter adhesin
MKTTNQSVLLLTLLCLVAVAAKVQAVLPPPDGGYPGGNTAEGQNALFNLTSGGFNTAVGWVSLHSETTGNFNTAVGAGTLFRTNGDENTAVGTGALLSNSTGIPNTATGAFALFSNTGFVNNPNRPNGELGSFNTADGDRALFNNTEGGVNTAVGYRALINNTTGFANTAIGADTMGNNSTGNGNIALGAGAGGAVSTANEVIAIGTGGLNVSNSCFIGQIYSNVQPQIGIDPDTVTITSSGRLGRANVSSRQYKHDIQPLHTASEAIYALKPVSFRYHKQYDQTQTIAFGLIAEEVAEVNPDLVGRNPEGQPESVRYEQINAMLLNEFLKEHRRGEEQDCKIQEQGTTIAELKSEIRRLAAMVNEQASELRNVNAQLQISNAAAQEIASNRP